MSFAQNDIDAGVAQFVPASEPAKAQVLVVSRTAAIGRAMAAEMALDAGVEGAVAQGTLTQIVAQGGQDWSAYQFVVFEISDEPQADLDALGQLRGPCGEGLQFVAMAGQPLGAQETALFKAAGVREILTVVIPDPAPEFPDVCVAAPVPAIIPTARAASGKITVILRARGGAGASTLAVNLAVASAALTGAGKTALVDLDIQGSAISLMLDLPESGHATEMLKGTISPDTAFLDKAMTRHTSGIDVLTAPDVFAPLTALTLEMVETLLSSLKAKYDNVIIDMPQGIADWINPIFAHATRVLLVSDTSLPSVKRTSRLIGIIGEEHMTLPVEVVINQHKKPLVKSAALKEVENLMGRQLHYWIPADGKATRRAIDMGQPLHACAKRSATTRAINALGKTLFTSEQKG